MAFAAVARRSRTLPWPGSPLDGRIGRHALSCFYYFAVVVVIRYEANATARRALTFIVRIFVNDTIAITVWTSFYFHVPLGLVARTPACS